MDLNTVKKLGNSPVTVPEIGTGLASWGENFLGYGKTHTAEDIYQAYRVCLDAGINFFDTAPGYGMGESERLLGKCVKKDGRPVIISTKFAAPDPLSTLFEPKTVPRPEKKRRTPENMMEESLDNSLHRLGVETVDLFTLHFPPAERLLDDYMDALAVMVSKGKARAVGVSNFSAPMLRRAHTRLAQRDIPLASVQSAFSLLYRYPEHNGVLDACRELNISLIATGPLAQGVLTGKHRSGETKLTGFQTFISQMTRIDWYGETKGQESRRERFFTKPRALQNEKLEPLFQVLEDIAKTHEKSIAQVAVNWLLAMDPLVIPIPGAKNARQAAENAGIAGWSLTEEEYRRISQAEVDSR